MKEQLMETKAALADIPGTYVFDGKIGRAHV